MIRLTLERTPKEDIIPLEGKLADIIGLPIGGFDYEIRKKSLDARKNRVKFVYTIDLFVQRNEEKIARKCKGSIMKAEEEYSFPASVFMPENRPVVAGFGPAGIFVALMLARNGLKPIVIERGKEGIERKKDVDTFFSPT